MKTMTRLLGLVALAAAFALPAFAQDPAASPAAAANPCESQERTDMYTDYYNKKKGDAAAQKAAYEVAKTYRDKYATACPDKYTESVTKFIKAYEEATEDLMLPKLVYTDKNYPEAFAVGRRILARKPDDLNVLMTLAYAGYAARTAGNNSLVSEASGYGKKALQQIEGGKAPATWEPYKSKEEAISYLNYYLGELALGSKDVAGSLPYFLKAATLEGPAKKSAATYGWLATAYQAAQYDRMQQEFNTKFGGKPETDESKFALDQLNQVIDRIIDAYARAVNLAGSDPNLAKAKTEWMQQLTNFYKFRHEDKTDGLDAYIASVANMPLPPPFEPKPYVPPAVPAPSPASDGANGTKPPAPAAQPAAQPSPTPTASKKPPVRR
jgi:hypothetical protein